MGTEACVSGTHARTHRHTGCICDSLLELNYDLSFTVLLVSVSLFLYNTACHPLCPSSLLDIWKLGCHLALCPRRGCREDVCESSHTLCVELCTIALYYVALCNECRSAGVNNVFKHIAKNILVFVQANGSFSAAVLNYIVGGSTLKGLLQNVLKTNLTSTR